MAVSQVKERCIPSDHKSYKDNYPEHLAFNVTSTIPGTDFQRQDTKTPAFIYRGLFSIDMSSVLPFADYDKDALNDVGVIKFNIKASNGNSDAVAGSLFNSENTNFVLTCKFDTNGDCKATIMEYFPFCIEKLGVLCSWTKVSKTYVSNRIKYVFMDERKYCTEVSLNRLTLHLTLKEE